MHFMVGAAAMDAMKDKTLAQGELLGLHTQNPDDWPKDEEASTRGWPLFFSPSNQSSSNKRISVAI